MWSIGPLLSPIGSFSSLHNTLHFYQIWIFNCIHSCNCLTPIKSPHDGANWNWKFDQQLSVYIFSRCTHVTIVPFWMDCNEPTTAGYKILLSNFPICVSTVSCSNISKSSDNTQWQLYRWHPASLGECCNMPLCVTHCGWANPEYPLSHVCANCEWCATVCACVYVGSRQTRGRSKLWYVKTHMRPHHCSLFLFSVFAVLLLSCRAARRPPALLNSICSEERQRKIWRVSRIAL